MARGLAGCDSSRPGRRSTRCRSGGGKAIRTEEHPEKGAHRTKVLQVGKAGGLHGSAVEAISARFTRVLCQRGVAPRLSSWKPGPRMDRATGAPGGRQQATEGRRKCLSLGDAAHSGGSGVVKHRALPARRRWRKSSADVAGKSTRRGWSKQSWVAVDRQAAPWSVVAGKSQDGLTHARASSEPSPLQSPLTRRAGGHRAG